MKSHQFACTECTASFATPKNLASHSIANFSMRSTKPNFQGTLCDLPFSTFNGLSYHKRVAHGCNRRNSSENVVLNSFQCSEPQFHQGVRSVQHLPVLLGHSKLHRSEKQRLSCQEHRGENVFMNQQKSFKNYSNSNNEIEILI